MPAKLVSETPTFLTCGDQDEKIHAYSLLTNRLLERQLSFVYFPDELSCQLSFFETEISGPPVNWKASFGSNPKSPGGAWFFLTGF